MSKSNKTECGVGLSFNPKVDEEIDAFTVALLRQHPPFKPHVTLAKFNEADAELLEKELEGFSVKNPPPPLSFSHMSIFQERGIIFIAPYLTDLLRRYHEKLWGHAFKAGFLDYDSFYAPSIWKPHCTIACGSKIPESADFPMALRGNIKTKLFVYKYEAVSHWEDKIREA